MKTRSELRNCIIIILYQIDIYNSYNINYSLEDIISDNECSEYEFVLNAINKISSDLSVIDDIINNLLDGWTIDRLDKVASAILRLGIYELKYTDTPKAVVIDEAVKLAKTYCSLELKGIINAVLDKYEDK